METYSHRSRAWKPPLELQRSTPREVQLTAKGKVAVVAMITFIVTAIAGAAVLAGKAAADERRWTAWQAEATSAQGEVTGLRKRGSGDDTKYYADYSYTVNERRLAGSAKVSSREWRRWKPGDTIEVVYRRSDPGVSWLPGHEPTGVPWFAALLFGGGLLIPPPILAYMIRRQRRLLEEGRAALATVVAKKKVSSEHGRHYRIRYEFETLEGARRTGRYQANRKAPEIGDEFVVIHHPDEENWNAKYPLCLVRVRTE